MDKVLSVFEEKRMRKESDSGEYRVKKVTEEGKQGFDWI